MRRIRVSAAFVAVLVVASCGHAPPVTGDRNPDAEPDPNRPEVNCQLYTTLDCRPAGVRPP